MYFNILGFIHSIFNKYTSETLKIKCALEGFKNLYISSGFYLLW